MLSGKARRNKGNTYERSIVNECKALGYPNAITSRLESKRMDDAGVDVLNVSGYHIQCKRTERIPRFDDILIGMPKDKVPVVFHKRNNHPDTVTMLKSDFYNMIKK